MKSSIFIVFAMVAVMASPVLALIGQKRPAQGEVALVIAPPFGQSIAEILQSAQMYDAYPDRAPMGAFVYLETPQSYARLLNEGAWIVLRGEEILKLC